MRWLLHAQTNTTATGHAILWDWLETRPHHESSWFPIENDCGKNDWANFRQSWSALRFVQVWNRIRWRSSLRDRQDPERSWIQSRWKRFTDVRNHRRNASLLRVQWTYLLPEIEAHGLRQDACESNWSQNRPHKIANRRSIERWRAETRRNGERLSHWLRRSQSNHRETDAFFRSIPSICLQEVWIHRIWGLLPSLQRASWRVIHVSTWLVLRKRWEDVRNQDSLCEQAHASRVVVHEYKNSN